MSQSRTTARFWAALTGVSMATTLGVGAFGAAYASPDAPTAAPTDKEQRVEREKQFEDGDYIVVMEDDAAASYEGGIDGLAPTKPAEGERLNGESPEVKAFAEHAEKKQEEVADEVGVEVERSLSATLNGFTAELTADQAAELAAKEGVAHVVPDRMLQLDTVSSPEFLGLTGGKGMWRQYGTPRRAGEGVVVGIIDSGISPQNPSFAGRQLKDAEQTKVNRPWMDEDGKTHMMKSDGNMWNGLCQTGEEWTLNDCNDKLIGARYYNRSTNPLAEYEFESARDSGGHGTHTASTAAGNYGVPMYIGDEFYGRGSGMAPGAKVAAYKVCFDTVGYDNEISSGCSQLHSYLAIEDAILDGVDVLNYSISGSRDNELDLIDRQFMNAANAGVFVAASAGNSGPTDSTVAHNAPWLTTVAASAFSHRLGTVELGNGEKFLGSSLLRNDTEEFSAVMSIDLAAEGVDPANAALCLADTLDAAKAAGKLVVCDRGQVARTAKSAEVERAGGAAMILRNVKPSSIDADDHHVPSVHVDEEAGVTIGEYVKNTENPTITLRAGNATDMDDPAIPSTAGFSSRGPALAGKGNLLKPDIAAPGQSVLAATAPRTGGDFQFMSGTSMSSPHIAGLAGLLYGKFPHMSPAAMKSAMMTTAVDDLDVAGLQDTNHFGDGAGFVDPTEFYNPGLVYDAGKEDWIGYLANHGLDTGDAEVKEVRDIDLNLPSFAIAEVVGAETVTRSVTSMKPGTWTASATMPGYDVTFEPSTLTFDSAGETKEYSVTFTRTDATHGEWDHGYITWNGTTEVRSPVVLKSAPLQAPTEITGEATDDATSFTIRAGDAGQMTPTLKGLAAAEVHTNTIKPGRWNWRDDEANRYVEFEIPEGTDHFRAELLSTEGVKEFYFTLWNMEASERPHPYGAGKTDTPPRMAIDLVDPKPGKYEATIRVNRMVADAEEGNFELRLFAVMEENPGNATVSPEQFDMVMGQDQEITVNHPGLDDQPYFGIVTLGDTGRDVKITLD